MRANPDRLAGRRRSEPHVRLIDQYPRLPPCPTEVVNVAAMLIASKFEEICPPEV